MNSATLSASCHPAVGDKDASLYYTKLGVVKHGLDTQGKSFGRLTFSSDRFMEEPIEGLIYQQPVWISSKRRGEWKRRTHEVADMLMPYLKF